MTTAQAGTTGRLTSLDAFRGAVVAAMLLVNNPGVPELAPAQFRHAPWGEGITLADLVMPWFLFVIGTSLPFWVDAHAGRPGFWRGLLRRTATLIGLGILLVSSAQKRLVIGLDVLQHLGIAGFLATTLYVRARRHRPWIITAILAGHWALLRFVPAPGVPAGSLQPDLNVVWWINTHWLAPLHLGGLISPMATTALVLLGTHAGEWLRSGEARRLVTRGLVLTLAGWAWGYDLFFSKALWTAPYLCYSAGLGMLLLTAFSAVFDRPGGARLGMPLVVFGRNAILAYFGAIMLKHHTIDEWRVEGGNMREAMVAWLGGQLGPSAGSMAWTLLWLGLVWTLCLALHRRRIYWRL